MQFTSSVFVVFFVGVFALYWLLPTILNPQNSQAKKNIQNIILLTSSYVFYGWVHPWFCFLLATSTMIDFLCAQKIHDDRSNSKKWLVLSLVTNLGMLGFFKYANFFIDNVTLVLSALGLSLDPIVLEILLPVGISFYTFQSMSYTIDIYRKEQEPHKSLVEFALFVSFFPQLVAGPIERARHILPQITVARQWNWDLFNEAWSLIIRGYFKKLFIANGVSFYVDKIFAHPNPSVALVTVGTVGFAIQIYADFSAYTDIARGTARLFGVRLMENFKSPYLAISPSDFWRRWHISFSSWIKDYVYISFGGSRVKTRLQFLLVVLATFGLSGLWHGAQWHYVIWGLYHAVILFVYHALGMGGKWRATSLPTIALSWLVMLGLSLFGWLIFRTPSMEWLSQIAWAQDNAQYVVAVAYITWIALYTLPFFIFLVAERILPNSRLSNAVINGLELAILLYMPIIDVVSDEFIYFQF